MFVVEKDR